MLDMVGNAMEMNKKVTLLLLALAGTFGLGLARGGGALFFRHGDELK